MAKDTKVLPNVKVLVSFRLKGEHQPVGRVISKADFAAYGEPNTGDWQNLVHMNPARAEETDEAVGDPVEPKVSKSDTRPSLPGADSHTRAD